MQDKWPLSELYYKILYYWITITAALARQHHFNL